MSNPAPPNPVNVALAFFASVIKSGEPWTPTCQEMLDAAYNELLRRLGSEAWSSSAPHPFQKGTLFDACTVCGESSLHRFHATEQAAEEAARDGGVGPSAARAATWQEILSELVEAAYHDMKKNQAHDEEDEPGGWWSLRTENAILAARALLAAHAATPSPSYEEIVALIKESARLYGEWAKAAAEQISDAGPEPNYRDAADNWAKQYALKILLSEIRSLPPKDRP